MKNLFKRLCCLVISLSVCASMVVLAEDSVTSVTQPQISNKLSTAMYFLRTMDIIGDYYDYNTEPSEKITRAEFADAVVRALGIKNIGRTDTYFYDVPLSHFACDQINALAEMGFVHGVGENRFDPDSYIYTVAACKIILSILGYEPLAEARGGYSKGYIDTAVELELIKYAEDGAVLTRGEMFLLLFEALKAPMHDISGFKGDSAILVKNENKTILSEYHQAYFDKGVVDGVRTSSFNGIDLEINEVDIDGKIFTTRIEMDDLLGEEVEYIAYVAEDTEECEIAVASKTGKTKATNIKAKNFIKFDKDNYKLFYYDTARKQRSITIERDVRLIYNGGIIDRNISDRLNEGCDLKVIKSNDGYDRIVAKKKKDITVKKVDVQGQAITNMLDSPKGIELKDRNSVFIRKDGEPDMTLDKIAVGDVLSIYESYCESPDEEGKYIEIRVSTDRITGSVEKISSNNSEVWVTVSGEKYRDLSGVHYRLPSSVELYLDIDGDIAYVNTDIAKDFAAYLIKGKVIEDTELYEEELLRLEMLKQDGTMARLKCTNKVKIDDQKIERAYEAFSLLSRPSVDSIEPQLVLVKIDEDGYISSIDTVKGKEEEGTLRSIFVKERVMFKETGYMGNNNTDIVAINTNTIFFRVPTEDMLKKGQETKEDYGIGWRGFIGDNDYVTATCYRTTEKKAGVAEYVVLEMSGKSSSTPWPILIENVCMMYDENEGEAYNVITGYDGYTKVEIPITENVVWKKKGLLWSDGDADKLRIGTVITCAKNSRGHATTIDLIYDPDNRAEYYGTGDYNGMINEIGIAEDASSNIIVVKIGTDGRSIANKSDSAEIMVYDDENRQIQKGTFLDAKLYADSYNQNKPETYSDVVVFQWQRWPRRAYIFRY